MLAPDVNIPHVFRGLFFVCLKGNCGKLGTDHVFPPLSKVEKVVCSRFPYQPSQRAMTPRASSRPVSRVAENSWALTPG